MSKKLEKIIEYATSEEVAPISRRYFTMNGFDGAMTLLGIVLGAIVVGIDSQTLLLVISSALGSTIALGLSGLTSAFMAERAERLRDLKKLEKQMQMKMEDTEIALESKIAPIWTAFVNSASPIITSLVALSPLLLALAFPSIIAPESAAYFAVALDLMILFLLGAYLGKVSKRNIILNGIKMVAAGVAMTFILFFVVK